MWPVFRHCFKRSQNGVEDALRAMRYTIYAGRGFEYSVTRTISSLVAKEAP